MTGILFIAHEDMPSAVIRTIEYAPETERLIIHFVSGAVYTYHDVPAPIVDQFRQLREKGIFYNREIKNKYRFTRVH